MGLDGDENATQMKPRGALPHSSSVASFHSGVSRGNRESRLIGDEWEGMALVASEDGDPYGENLDENPLKVLAARSSPATRSQVSGCFSPPPLPAVPRSKRPTKEVINTVDHIFALQTGGKRYRSRIHTLVSSLVNDTCPMSELATFYAYLQALLTTLFAPFATYADSKDKAVDESNPISYMMGAPIMNDVVAAARFSLKEYHFNNVKGPMSNLQNKVLSGIGSFRRKSLPPESRRLSCHMQLVGVGGGSFNSSGEPTSPVSVVESFAGAFTEGNVPNEEHKPVKRRPDSRIDRRASDASAPTLPKYPHSPNHGLDSTVSSTIPLHSKRSGENLSRHVSGFDSSLSHYASPARAGSLTAAYLGSSFQTSSNGAAAALSAAQFFDIIIETICVVLTIKYEHQLMELTVDGEGSGVRRAAEWVAARILDEMYNDGIDRSQPLCGQLILCAEGLAYEDGKYVWRHSSTVGSEVMAVVWGEPPEDVLEGRLELKQDDGMGWYEWGCFTQPGIRTPDGRLFTGPKLNPLQYRYRLAPLHMVDSLSLRNTNTAPLRAPSFLAHRPGACVQSSSGDVFSGITLSAPPEGSEHRGGTIPRPHIRPQSPGSMQELEKKYLARYGGAQAEDAYCDTDLYNWSFEEALQQQREGEKRSSYNSMADRCAFLLHFAWLLAAC
ncbi:hypothetical protein DIPPA_04642 [Diplonema papillatum]|nr:hypothetical protein DIPPA_04642 [Diplonema papillatum]